jgi:hypothetical protein
VEVVWSIDGYQRVMAVWQMRIAHSPILMISGSIATLSCEGEDASIYMLSDLAVVQGNVPTCLAFLTAASIGIPMVAIGLFANPALPFQLLTSTFHAENCFLEPLLPAVGLSSSPPECKGVSWTFFFMP